MQNTFQKCEQLVQMNRYILKLWQNMTQQCLIKFNTVITNAWFSYNYGGKCCNQRRCLSVASSVAFFFFFFLNTAVILVSDFSLSFFLFFFYKYNYSDGCCNQWQRSLLCPLFTSPPSPFFKNYCSGGCCNQWRCFPLSPLPPL